MGFDESKYMKEAIKEAIKAYEIGEVPVGAIIVHEGKIIGRGYNQRESKKNALYHAEIIAIDEASRNLEGWRLINSTMYVTLEPCAMCAGAIVNSRIENIVIGAWDLKRGCCGSKINLLDSDYLNHKVNIYNSKYEDECSNLISNFFKELRGD